MHWTRSREFSDLTFIQYAPILEMRELRPKSIISRGTWVAQSVEHPTLDLAVHGIEPHVGLWADIAETARDSLSLFLSLSLSLSLSLPLPARINTHIFFLSLSTLSLSLSNKR